MTATDRRSVLRLPLWASNHKVAVTADLGKSVLETVLGDHQISLEHAVFDQSHNLKPQGPAVVRRLVDAPGQIPYAEGRLVAGKGTHRGGGGIER